MAIKLKSVPRPAIKLKVLPRFPATVLGTNGVTVVQSGLTYTFSLDPAFSPSFSAALPFAVGDIFYAVSTAAVDNLADVATGNVLLSGGVGVAPAWGKVALTTHVSGILPAANGGTGVANSSTITLGGAITTAAAFTTSGAFALILTTTGATNVTLPTSGTLTRTADKLSVFAATTSAELAGVISDETGTGALVFASSPTLVTPALGTPGSGVLTNCTGLPLSGHTTQAAYTFVGNNTGSSAVPTAVDIAALTTKASPALTDYVMISDQAASGAWKKATVSAVSAASGPVTSLNAQTGALLLRIAPGGRLTLATGVPVMTSSQAAQGTVYYTPDQHDQVTLYDGTNLIPTTFTELSQATTDATKSPAAVAANKNYYMLAWNDSGTVRCTRSPAWSGDNTVGTGAGTAELIFVKGLWLNKYDITNGPAAQRGTMVGMIRSNGSSLIDYIFGSAGSGGVAGSFGVWNTYNRVLTVSRVTDNGASYNYTTATVRQARASAGNQISFVRGLAEDGVVATMGAQLTVVAVAGSAIAAGLGLDSTTVFDPASYALTAATAAVTSGVANPTGHYNPGIGWHTISRNEVGDGTNANQCCAGSKDFLGIQLVQ